MTRTLSSRQLNDATVLGKALGRAAENWGITNKQLGEVIGLSEATISRLKKGTYILDPNSKPWQLAILLLRTYRGLDAYMGGHKDNQKLWLTAQNDALGGVPVQLMNNIEGLAHVTQYVDYMRGQ